MPVRQLALTVLIGAAVASAFSVDAVGRADDPIVVPVTPPGVFVCVRYVAVDPNHPGTVYAATYDPWSAMYPYPGASVYKSTDGGASWIDIRANLPHNFSPAGIAVDTRSVVYTCSAGGGGSLYRSADGGVSWQVASYRWTQNLVADPSTPGTLYAYVWGIWKTIDGGVTWTFIDTGLGEPLPGQGGPGISTLAIDPSNPSILYAGRWEKGIYKSTDGGMQWQPLNLGCEPSGVVSIAVDPNNFSVVFAGTAEDGLFKSTDGGVQWASVNTGQPNPQFFALAFDKNSTLYAGVYDLGVLVSDDSGVTWTGPVSLPSNYIITLVADPVKPGRVYAGSLQ